ILFGSFIHSGKSDDEIAIDYLFGKKEIFDKFKVDPNMLWKNSYQDRVTFTRDGKKHTVTIKKSHFEWARILYFRNVWFAAYLEKFRKALANNTQMAFQELEAFLQKSDKKAKQMVNGPSYINALPFMVLDEMVLLSNGDKPGNRTALMEIILYDKTGEKELSYIPISS
ncbi:MAG: hypothetical protein GY757_54590, partial [bacterium]|nr:hypothetical protein [bacterium]